MGYQYSALALVHMILHHVHVILHHVHVIAPCVCYIALCAFDIAPYDVGERRDITELKKIKK